MMEKKKEDAKNGPSPQTPQRKVSTELNFSDVIGHPPRLRVPLLSRAYEHHSYQSVKIMDSRSILDQVLYAVASIADLI